MRQAELYSPAIGAAGNVLVYGHYGRPVLVFPAEGGSARDWDHQGMVHALGGLLEAGRCKLYCVDAFDSGERWRYESWVIDQVAPFIHADQGGPQDILATGSSTSSSGARTCSPPPSACPATTTSGSPARCPGSTATTSTGSARARASCSSAARACGRTPRARSRARSASPAC